MTGQTTTVESAATASRGPGVRQGRRECREGTQAVRGILYGLLFSVSIVALLAGAIAGGLGLITMHG